LQLRDVWKLRGEGQGFTFRRAEYSSRIDRIYVSKELENKVTSVKVLPVAFSDHCAVECYVKLNVEYVPCKPGTWKMNNYILKDKEFKNEFKKKWDEWGRKKSKYATSLSGGSCWLRGNCNGFANPSPNRCMVRSTH